VTIIAEVPTPDRIVFGTDGWRARVADDFTFENVRRCADGVARYVVDRGETSKGVVVAYDRNTYTNTLLRKEAALLRGLCHEQLATPRLQADPAVQAVLLRQLDVARRDSYGSASMWFLRN
jgi:phosphomannomutase